MYYCEQPNVVNELSCTTSHVLVFLCTTWHCACFVTMPNMTLSPYQTEHDTESVPRRTWHWVGTMPNMTLWVYRYHAQLDTVRVCRYHAQLDTVRVCRYHAQLDTVRVCRYHAQLDTVRVCRYHAQLDTVRVCRYHAQLDTVRVCRYHAQPDTVDNTVSESLPCPTWQYEWDVTVPNSTLWTTLGASRYHAQFDTGSLPYHVDNTLNESLPCPT